jgi:RNA polymerase sigma-70 factor, ECF subfamily
VETQPHLDEDRELLRRCQEGDERAFEELVRKHQQTLFHIVYHTIGQRAEVEDLAQKIFTKVYFSLSKFDLERPFLPWLYRVAINQCYDELRRMRRHRVRTFTDLRLDDIDQIENLIGSAEAGEPLRESHSDLFALMHALIERIPKSQRTALILRDLNDVPYEDIAGSMGVSEQAVRLKVMRARSRLRQLMEKALRRKSLRLRPSLKDVTGTPRERRDSPD